MPTEKSQKTTIYITVRPGAHEFLKQLQNYYEIIIFTASLKEYADKVIDKLDPTKQLISHRLYRENCSKYHGYFIKDLNKLGRNKENVIIIDNSINSFLLQQQNGYLIPSFFEDMNDNELQNLLAFLIEISKLPDLRKVEQLKNNYDTNKKRKLLEIQKDFDNQSEDSSKQNYLSLEFKVIDEDEIEGISAQANASLAKFQTNKNIGPSEKLENLNIQQKLINQVNNIDKDKQKVSFSQLIMDEQKNKAMQKQQNNNSLKVRPNSIKIYSKTQTIKDSQNQFFQSNKSFGFQQSENFSLKKLQKTKKKQILQINPNRLQNNSNNVFSPLARQQYFDQNSEIFLV